MRHKKAMTRKPPLVYIPLEEPTELKYRCQYCHSFKMERINANKKTTHICTDCHHLKMCPEHRHKDSHECPLNSNGKPYKCTDVTSCPTCALSKHPDFTESVSNAQENSRLFHPSLDAAMKNYNINSKPQQADTLQALLQHFQSTSNPEKTSQVARDNYNLCNPPKSNHSCEDSNKDPSQLSFEELVAEEDILQKRLQLIKDAKLQVQFQQHTPRPSLGRRCLSDGDLSNI